jgi:hypothetical protein
MKETHRKKTPSGLSTLFRKVKVQIGSKELTEFPKFALQLLITQDWTLTNTLRIGQGCLENVCCRGGLGRRCRLQETFCLTKTIQDIPKPMFQGLVNLMRNEPTSSDGLTAVGRLRSLKSVSRIEGTTPE